MYLIVRWLKKYRSNRDVVCIGSSYASQLSMIIHIVTEPFFSYPHDGVFIFTLFCLVLISLVKKRVQHHSIPSNPLPLNR